MKETGASAAGGSRAVARGLVAAALALSLIPSLAYADTEKAGTDATAANNESAPTLSENEETSSTADYTATLLAEDSTESNTYDLSSIDLSKIPDRTYTGTATVDSSDPLAASSEWDIDSYEITVSVTVKDGKITAVTSDESKWPTTQSGDYMDKALNGNSRGVTGMASKIVEANNTNVDGVSGATVSSNAIKEAVYNALTAAAETSEYTYGYVGLTWAEYWENEGVYNATNTSSSEELDSHNEADKGGFDTVSRATTNHGLHRGSYQCIATIHTQEGTDFTLASWKEDGSAFYTTDGTEVAYAKGVLTVDGATYNLSSYEVYGTKYVPVAVPTVDLAAFKEKYTFVENGGTLAGGYSEKNLTAYTAIADVTKDTYGLKTATKESDGSFSFSARSIEGTDSGLADQELKTATGIEPNLRQGDDVGSYGEFIRLDLNGDYGDLGANMQSVTWTYYGDDSSYATPVATYGTKFAADNWMHKNNGIQLGLTKSARCQIPDGYNGTGYWTVTVHALGYKDYSYSFQATEENIADVRPVTDDTLAELKALYEKANALDESDYTADTWKNLVTERDETATLLQQEDLTEASASEQITHLTEAMDALVTNYVWMNIPYSKFYANELTNNTVEVDGFTSATKNKSRTGSMVGGSYHVNSDGSDITGITFPVKVADGVDVAALAKKLGGSVITDESSVTISVTNRGTTSETTYTGKDALFEAASYSYYQISGTDLPSYYKELSLDADGNLVFGEVKDSEGNKATATKLTGISSELTTDTTYGDYELDFDTDENATDKLGTTIPGGSKVYAAVVNAKDDSGNVTSYGLRHMENIWNPKGIMELAWCTGFTEKVHNCPTSSEHYKTMMGKTITSVTFYTERGIYEVQVNGEDGTYVPVLFDTSAATVADAQVGDASTTVTLPELPEGFEAVYTIEGWGGDVAIENGLLAIPSGQENGSYTLTVTDKSGKYAGFSASFELKADAAVVFDDDADALKTTDGSDITAYTGAISSVTLNGNTYQATGRGSTQLFNSDGTLITDSDPVASLPAGTYEMTISATGYNDLTITYTKEVSTQAMYRLYNPNSGEHFYTASVDERDSLVNVGWNYEGIGWTAPVTSSTPVYRLYNPNVDPTTGSGEHHFTTSTEERDNLVSLGWTDEGIGWYSDDAKGVPLYRQYNPNQFNCNHNYTTSTDERDYLVSLGWDDEGIGWYGVASKN